MASFCHGNGSDHCCYVGGRTCLFLEVGTVEGRIWVCGLRRELGSWNAVHADPRYQAEVRPVWEQAGVADCGDFTGLADGTKQCCYAEE